MSKRERVAFGRRRMDVILGMLVATFAAAASPSIAASPAVVIASTSGISPAEALTYYGAPTSPSPPAARDPLVQEMARSLRYDVDLIFEYVRDNVKLTPMFGLQKGARGVILDGYGTAFDQAQFMVDLLREADAVAGRGYAPSYELGRIELPAAEFSAWTGIADASLATRFLADGGIPATVSGSGANFTVSMLHIWVKVTISGDIYRFDPSYKPSTRTSGLNWKPSTSYSQGFLLGQGGGNVSPTSISNFNTSQFRQQLNQYRANIEAFVTANAVGQRAEVMVGDDTISPHGPADDRRTVLPHVVSTDRTWAGQIPDIFRTSFKVSLNGDSYGDWFADVQGGSVLGFSYGYNGTSFVKSGIITGPIVSGSFLDACDTFQSDRVIASAPATAEVVINHPYAANGGIYSDRTITRQLARQQCAYGRFYVSNDWGVTGGGVSQRLAPKAAELRYDYTKRSEMVFAPTLANVASQHWSFLDLAGRAQNTVYQLHDLVGIHTLDNIITKLEPGDSNFSTSLSMSYEASVSVLDKTGGANADTAAAFIAALSLSYAEGAVPRQETDSVYDLAALNMVTQQDVRANPSMIYNTYLATPATWGAVSPQLSSYPSNALSAMQTYVVTEGYSVLAPQKGALRQPRITVTVTGAGTRTSSLWEGQAPGNQFEVERSAFFAWRPGAGPGTKPDRVALVMFDQRRGGILKAGIGVPIAVGAAQGELIRKPEAPKAVGKDIIRAALNVDGRSGALTFAPAPDLVDGSGEFPQSLSLQRMYDQRDKSNYGFGTGWKSNWYQVATLSNDGKAALGESGAQAIASALVTIQVMSDLVTTQDAQHLYAAAQTAAWLTDQTLNNSIVVTRGLDGEQAFFRQAAGNFVSASPDGATLTLSAVPQVGIINRWLYRDTNITYTDANGSVRSYKSANSPSAGVDSPAIASLYTRKSMYLDAWNFPNGIQIRAAYDSSVAANDIIYLLRVYNNLGSYIRAKDYTSGGEVVGPTSEEGIPGSCATAGGRVIFVPPSPARITYVTPTAKSIFTMTAQTLWEFTGSSEPPFRCSPGKTTPDRRMSPLSSELSGNVGPSGYPWSYGYMPAQGIFGSVRSLSSIHKPLQAVPAASVLFGSDTNVRTISNLRDYSWSYFSSPFRSEVLTPLQATGSGFGTRVYYDQFAQPVRVIDPLSRVTLTGFDTRGRPFDVTRPEGDRTVKAYDVRGNVVSETRKPKPIPGSLLPDIVNTTAYFEGPTVACVNLIVCNKPIFTVDPRNVRTNYGWSESTGVLQSVAQGYDVLGTVCQVADGCPLTTYNYTSSLAGYDPFNGIAMGSLSLLEGKSVAITASTTTTTGYGYTLKEFPGPLFPLAGSPLKRILVKEMVVDSGGLALRSCYGYDPSGNVISETTPRADLTVCP